MKKAVCAAALLAAGLVLSRDRPLSTWEMALGTPIRRKPNIVKKLNQRERIR